MTIALVTGATRGIGRAVAEGLAGLGMTVLAGARDPATPGSIHLDVTDSASLRAAAAVIGERYGRLDVLVNNAGIAGPIDRQSPGQVDLDVVRQVAETNVLGTIATTEAMLPLLRRSTGARIVNVSSSVGSLARMRDWTGGQFAALPASLAYAPSKAALNQVTVQYAKALAAEGILVNAADPGACATDFTAGLGMALTRTATDGAAIVVRLATLPDDGPSGGYLADTGPVPW